MADRREDSRTQTAVRQEVRPPRLYRVLLHNDDFTTVEFVMQVLRSIFRQTTSEAHRITMDVHHRGVGVAGVYPRQIAESKTYETTQLAQQSGMPLLVTAEPEPGGSEDSDSQPP